MLEGGWIVSELVHDTGEVVGIGDLDASAAGLEFLGFLELMVVGTEDDGEIPYCCLGEVVDAVAEATADIGDGAVLIDGGEETETVDDENLGIDDVGGTANLGIAYNLAVGDELLHNHVEMALGDDMGRDDEFPIAMMVEIVEENLLVGQPRGTGDKNPRGVLGQLTI